MSNCKSTYAEGSGEFLLEVVTESRKTEISKFIQEFFAPRETITSKLKMSPKEIRQMNEDLAYQCIKHNASIMAFDKTTQEIAGICLTKILDRETMLGFDDLPESGNDKEKNMMQILEKVEKSYNVFEDPNINKVLEIVMTSTNPEFSGRGLVYRLSEKVEELARKLQCDAMISQSTGPATQHIRTKLGYDCVKKVYYNSLSVDGEPLDGSQGEAGPFIGIFVKPLSV